MSRKLWEVKPRGRRWAVKRRDAQCADSIFDLLEDAVARGAEVAERNHGRLRVRGRDGRVQDERSYGDP